MLVRFVLPRDIQPQNVFLTHNDGHMIILLHVNNKKVFKFAYIVVDVMWF